MYQTPGTRYPHEQRAHRFQENVINYPGQKTFKYLGQQRKCRTEDITAHQA